MAFLIPAVDRLLRNRSTSTSAISVLVMSRKAKSSRFLLLLKFAIATRELAAQIADTAAGLIAKTGLGCQTVTGGTNMKSETSRLASQRCDILVATPGRLVDHLENGSLRNQLTKLQVLVLDEADVSCLHLE